MTWNKSILVWITNVHPDAFWFAWFLLMNRFGFLFGLLFDLCGGTACYLFLRLSGFVFSALCAFRSRITKILDKDRLSANWARAIMAGSAVSAAAMMMGEPERFFMLMVLIGGLNRLFCVEFEVKEVYDLLHNIRWLRRISSGKKEKNM